jgi:hypothetical protein
MGDDSTFRYANKSLQLPFAGRWQGRYKANVDAARVHPDFQLVTIA